jgi:hypothetical protein
MKKLLHRTTLVCIATRSVGDAVISMKKSMEKCDFRRAVLFSNINPKVREIETILIPTIHSKPEYSQFVVKELWKHITTDFVLITQADSWVLDAHAWTDEFYDYDYIGAPWLYQDGRNVGNGGFALLSKKLLTALGTDDFIQIASPDDEIIGRLYRNYLERTHGIRFPSDELADTFAFELREPVCSTFGFHSFFHEPYRPSVVIRRMGAMGDVLATEPVLRWLHETGYHVYLETSPYFQGLFEDHYFPVKPAHQKDGRIPFAYYNLDMAYESVPNRNHVEAYFDFCGIEAPLSAPRLSKFGHKLFDKYVVFHIADRPHPHRNIGGIDWSVIRALFEASGYLCLEIGEKPTEDFLYAHTPNMATMKWVVGHADYFVGIDSGPSNIAVAMGVRSFIFAGSVGLSLIHADLTNVVPIEVDPKCGNEKCWHKNPGVSGQDCIVDKDNPPCVNFDTEKTVETIKQWIGEK